MTAISLLCSIGLLDACRSERISPSMPAGGAQSRPIEQTKWTTQRDDWYSLTLAGIHAGWMRIVREDDGKRYRSVTETTLEYHRDGMNLDVASLVEWIESRDGTPLHLKIAQKNKDNPANAGIAHDSAWERTRNGDPSGLLSIKYEWEFDGDTVTKIGMRDGQQIRASFGKPNGPWLTPAAIERSIGRHISAGARAFEYETLDASDTLRGINVRCALIGPSDFPFNGKMIPVSVWKTTNSINSGETVSHYSPDGRLMYSSLDTGTGMLETRLCTKDEAISGAGVRPTTAPDVEYPVVKPDRPLTAMSRAVFEVRLKEGKLPRLPSAGGQTVEASEDVDSARVSVDAMKTSPATDVELMENQRHEESGVDATETRLVLELAAQSIQESQGLGMIELARSSRAIVQRHFASQAVPEPASRPAGAGPRGGDAGLEKARTLCAVLRVHRIASRLASGLAYSVPPRGDGVFEWRCWTQALIDGRWLDLDPTGTDPFNAAHILSGFAGIGATDADPDPAGFAKLLSKVEIRVISQE